MDVIKIDGQRVKFDASRIRAALGRIKAKPAVIDHVVRNVERQVYDGMTTGEMFGLVRRELHQEDKCLAHRYNLRSGLLKLGPAGFKFEKYVAAVLQAYEYETEIPKDELRGLCVSHEVDVVAVKGGTRVMIEAKFRNSFEVAVTLKDTMATWARYMDLIDGAKHGFCEKFNEVWIVTNGRFSDRAKQFGVCKDMHLIGWSAEEQSLARMVDHAALYPVTVIDDLRPWELDKFAERDVLLCRELAVMTPSAVAKLINTPEDRAAMLIDEAKDVIKL